MTTHDAGMGPRPLDGVRVLALTHGMAGAIATMVLADFGADVILVEHRADGLLRRSGGHSLWNRGKRSLAVDLDDESQRRLLVALAEQADVVIDDHRPGTASAWGLGYDDLSARNGTLAYCSISAYGQDDPDRDRPGADAAVAARLGVMNEWGGHREGPIFLGHPSLNYAAALLAVIGALAAVHSRLHTGHGDYIDVSLRDGALSLYPMNWWAERQVKAIDQKVRGGSVRFGNKRILLKMFECADARLIYVHTAAPGAFDRAMEVFGLGDEVTKMEGTVQMSSLLTDRDMEILDEQLPGIIRSRNADEWLRLLWGNNVAGMAVQQPGEALDDDQIRHAGVVRSVDDPALGRIEMVGPVMLLSETPGAIAHPAPTFDEHGDEIRSAGWHAPGLPPVADPATAARPPLDGLRVIDFATFFASPYGSRLLGDLGAEVIKVEGLDGDPMRPLWDMFEGSNRGKLGMSVDLKHPDAAAIVAAIVRGADVVQHNLRPGAAERIGIDEATLREIEPALIYQYSPGYGSSGPKATLQSFAPLLSSLVGQLAIAAGEGNIPHPTFGNEDYYNGLLSAAGCLLAVIHRDRTGTGQYVETSQLHSSIFTTAEYYKVGGEYRTVIPRIGPGQFGWAAGHRLYQALDGWLCVTCVRDEQVDALARAVLAPEEYASLNDGERGLDQPETSRLSELLEYHFFERVVADWVVELEEHGVPIEAVREDSWLAEASYHDPDMLASERIIEFDHPIHGRVRIVGDVLHFRHHPSAHRGRAHLLGEHTTALLQEHGFSADEVERLVGDGVIRSLHEVDA